MRALRVLVLLSISISMSFAQTGSPHPDDGYWDNRFATARVVVGSNAVAANGKLYVIPGPALTFRNGFQYNAVAIWDGTAWTYTAPFSGTGASNIYTYGFETILPNETTFHIAGSFPNLNGQGIRYIAHWNGTAWDSLGPQLNGSVHTMYAGVGGLYVGGEFTKFGDSTANRLAVWDSGKWNKMIDAFTAEGVSGTVWTVAATQSHLYFGGAFTTAGGVTGVNRVAQWNWTTKQWAKIGNGFNNEVRSLVNNLGTMWAGGLFTQSGVHTVEYVAQAVDTGWANRRSNLPLGLHALHSPQTGGIYAVGNFYNLSGNEKTEGAAFYNGSTWVGLGVWPHAGPFITGEASDIYFSVGESHDSSRFFHGAGKWNGSSWNGLGHPVGTLAPDIVYALGYANSVVFTAGDFRIAGDIQRYPKLNLVMFEGGRWKEVGGALRSGTSPGYVYAFGTIGTNLYAAGLFSQIGSTGLRNIGQWNGTSWSALGSGLNNTARAIASNGTDLFVAGIFDSAGGQWVNGIAKWNGSTWSRLRGGLSLGADPRVLVVNGNELYVAGRFSSVDSGRVAAEDFAKWNGSIWSGITPPVPPLSGSRQRVTALAMIGNDLYAGVNYATISGERAFVFKWNGSQWTQIGGAFNHYIHALYANGADLYVTGDFTVIGTDTAWRIAKWSGSTWTSLGTGLIGNGRAVLGTPDGLFVGGTFTQAGKYLSTNIALWKNYTHQGQLLGLNAPLLSSPADGGTDQPLSLTLSWIAVSNATSYAAQLSTDSTFATTVVNDSNLSAPSKGVSGLMSNTKYFWRVRASNSTQTSLWSAVSNFRTTGATSVRTGDLIPSEYFLGQNYPNPFNPTTLIEFGVPARAVVELVVYDLLGRPVASLLNEERFPGYHSVVFDGGGLPSGVYFFKLTATGPETSFVQIRKLVLLR
ncbi:MAG TPA: T9SS type A sorting domain-containing protein [Bacteroidota bacterium]|nr:T9SS type A sorting domain-containing protein [Bacteroidota bacterium]